MLKLGFTGESSIILPPFIPRSPIADIILSLLTLYSMKLNKIETSEALSLTKPSYSVPPELEAAWLGYKHSIQGGKKNEEEQESFWKNVVEDVEKGLGLVKPWKRDGAEEVEAELLGKGRGHGVPLSGQYRQFDLVYI